MKNRVLDQLDILRRFAERWNMQDADMVVSVGLWTAGNPEVHLREAEFVRLGQQARRSGRAFEITEATKNTYTYADADLDSVHLISLFPLDRGGLVALDYECIPPLDGGEPVTLEDLREQAWEMEEVGASPFDIEWFPVESSDDGVVVQP